jgi:hypothetical protein
LYGVPAFLADIDKGRDWWREGGVVGELIEAAVNEAFDDVCEIIGIRTNAKNALEFRQRYILRAIELKRLL